jgi:hypothetical protein
LRIAGLALELIGPDTRRGREVGTAWQYPGFRRAFRVITAAWGAGYVIEVTSTGIALVCSKAAPYLSAVSLSAWTLVYGEHERVKAERLAVIAAAGPETSSVP